MVLAGADCTLTDVRHQPNVGADAVDDRGRYYELKVHQGAIPDTVKLEDSQIQRAMAAPDDFFLVIVGNVEDGNGNPEVRIIHDPLHHLTVQPQGAVHLTRHSECGSRQVLDVRGRSGTGSRWRAGTKRLGVGASSSQPGPRQTRPYGRGSDRGVSQLS